MGKTDRDWVPHSEMGLLNMMDRWTTVLSTPAKWASYGWPREECEVVVQVMGAFRAERETYIEDDSTERRFIKNQGKKTAIAAMRLFASAYVRSNKRVPLEEKLYLGVNPRVDRPTPVAKPEMGAPFTMSRGAFMQAVIRHGPKPYGMSGAVFRYAALPPLAPAPLHDALTAMAFLTKPVERLDFSPDLKGHILYGAMSWLSRSGKEGPISEVRSLVLG